MIDGKFPVYLDAEEAEMAKGILEKRLDSIDRRMESLRKSAKELGVFSFDKNIYTTYNKLIRKAERERDVLTDAWSAIVRARRDWND